MKKRLIALLILFGTNAGYSQGINGKRMSAETEFDYFMRFFSPTEKVFTIGGKVRIGYVAAERWQVYAGANYYKLNYLQPVYDPLTDDLLGDATDNITCKELDFTARYFLPGFGNRKYDCIAPDGKYFEFGLITTQTHYSPGELSAFHDSSFPATVQTTRLSLGIGNQQVWWNIVVVNTGILTSAPIYNWGHHGDAAPYLFWNTGFNLVRGYVSIGVIF